MPKKGEKFSAVTIAVHFPGSSEGKRFCEFFTHRYNFIEAPASTTERPDWRTVSGYPIEHRNLWNRYRDPKKLIGLSFGSTTHYTLLDVDSRSPYHPANDEAAFKALLGAYEDIGLNDLIMVQSSYSEGIHVYFVFPKELPTYKVAQTMKLTAIRSGFTVKDGTLEIFPNAKPYNPKKPTPYKAHRLPLQEGSFLLDQDFTPYSNDIGVFLDQAEQAAAAQDMDLFEMAMKACEGAKAFRHLKGDGAKAAAFAADLLEQIEEGWTDFGQTNDLLRIIGTYGRVFAGLEGQALSDYIAETAQSLPGYHQFCRHQHHIKRRASEWARCVEKFYYPYGSEPRRVGSFSQLIKKSPKENQVNQERQQSSLKRIQEGIAYLRQTVGQLPQKVGERKEALLKAISFLFGVRPSDKTLQKNRHLWHPQFILEEEIVVVTEQDCSVQDVDLSPVQAGEQGEQSREKSWQDSPPPPAPGTPTVLTNNLLLSEQDCPPADQSPEPAPAGSFEPSPTPQTEVEPKEPTAEPLKPSPAEQSAESAPPPLYMKVRAWAEGSTILIYQGNLVSGLVQLEGEKRSKLQWIEQDQKVLIDSYDHSSFLFNPEDEQNLLVYVKPIEQQTTWKNGIVVRAQALLNSS